MLVADVCAKRMVSRAIACVLTRALMNGRQAPIPSGGSRHPPDDCARISGTHSAVRTIAPRFRTLATPLRMLASRIRMLASRIREIDRSVRNFVRRSRGVAPEARKMVYLGG